MIFLCVLVTSNVSFHDLIAYVSLKYEVPNSFIIQFQNEIFCFLERILVGTTVTPTMRMDKCKNVLDNLLT